MAMASGFFGITLEDSFDATALDPNLDADTVTVALVTDTFTPNFNTHDQYADITNELASTGGYTQPGQNLAGQTWAVSTGLLPFDSNDPAWTTATFTARGGVGYDNTLTGDPLLWATTFGADYSVTSGTFTWQVAAGGHFSFDIIP